MKIISPFAALLAAFALTLSPASVSLAYTMPSDCDGSDCDSEFVIAEDDADSDDSEHAGFTLEDDTEEEEELFTLEDSTEENEEEFTLDDGNEEEEEQYILDEGDSDLADESFVLSEEEEEDGEI